MKHFSAATTRAIQATKYMKIRAGDHRFIHVWVAVVDGRVLVRSWNDKPTGWFRAFRAEPRGAILVGDRELPVRARQVRSARLNAALDSAYAAKYDTKANQKYVKGFATPRRHATTLELLPA